MNCAALQLIGPWNTRHKNRKLIRVGDTLDLVAVEKGDEPEIPKKTGAARVRLGATFLSGRM